MAGLRDRRILGIRAKDGHVICPPTEYDPETGEDARPRLVEVGPNGEVTTWAWVEPAPRRSNRSTDPFAWALISLDGADTALLHAVDAGDESRMRTGMRVRPRWRDERDGRHPRHRVLRARGADR